MVQSMQRFPNLRENGMRIFGVVNWGFIVFCIIACILVKCVSGFEVGQPGLLPIMNYTEKNFD